MRNFHCALESVDLGAGILGHDMCFCCVLKLCLARLFWGLGGMFPQAPWNSFTEKLLLAASSNPKRPQESIRAVASIKTRICLLCVVLQALGGG